MLILDGAADYDWPVEGDVVVGYFFDAIFSLQLVGCGDEISVEGLRGLFGGARPFHPVVEGHVDLSCLVVSYFEPGVCDQC